MPDHLFMSEVTQPVLIKDGDLFLVSCSDGTIADGNGNGDGAGLFFHDTRFVSRYALKLGDQPPMPLMASSAHGRQAVLQLSNYHLSTEDGCDLPLQSLGIELHRRLEGESRALFEALTIRSFAPNAVQFTLSLELDARFEDLFELRGAKPKIRGKLTRTTTASGLSFEYEGADSVRRALEVSFSPCPSGVTAHEGGPAVAVFDLELEPQASATLGITFHVLAADEPSARLSTQADPAAGFFDDVHFASDCAPLEAVMHRSFSDLRMLQTRRGHEFIAGGLPWFVAPFARDSIIAALQTLPFDSRPAEGIARLLAAHQGSKTNAETREEPGKIAHELRVGEMAQLREIPHHPSYFSIDATPLFLVLIGRHVAWTGCLDLFNELRGAIDQALTWLETHGDTDGDGYVDYRGVGDEGPINQGWKDSSRAIVHPDGRLAEPPIALCEVQGYVYLAKMLLASAYRQAGELQVAARLTDEAQELARRFNQDFWMADEGCFCLALAAGGEQVRTVASNAGHALWSGITEADKARRTAERLLRPDMSSGWGVRTLSNTARAYNPLHYHLGSVWPFDNALLVEGLIRYGLTGAAETLFKDVLQAATCFSLGRLPEFYVGFQRAPDLFPARCPFAEPLQAWSAGAVPAMVIAFLGLRRCSVQGLTLDKPQLPPGAGRISMDLRTAREERLRCEFARTASGDVEVQCRGPGADVPISRAHAIAPTTTRQRRPA